MTRDDLDTETHHNPKERPAKMMMRGTQAGAVALILFFLFGFYAALKPQVGAPLAAGMVLTSGLMAAFFSHATGPDTHE